MDRCVGLIAEKQLCMGILVHGQASRGLTLAGLLADYVRYRWHLMSTENWGKGGRPAHVSEACIHRLEAAVSRFMDNRLRPLPGDEADAGMGRLTASAVRRSTFAQPALEGLRIAAYAPAEPGVLSSQCRLHVTSGHAIAQLSSLVFAVDFDDSPSPPAVSLGSRVYVACERGDVDPTSQQGDGGVGGAPSRVFLVGGLVVRIVVTEGVCTFLNDLKYLQVVERVCFAGLSATDDVESTATTHPTQSARMPLMEKAAWQRYHHRQMRNIYRKRVRKRDRRCTPAKYPGIISVSLDCRTYPTQQLSDQMRFVVKTLRKKVHLGQRDHHRRAASSDGYGNTDGSSAAHRLPHVGVFFTVRNKEHRPRSVEALGVDSQALACTQHTTDAVSRNHLINITAASGNGLAELLAAVHPRRVPAARHASQLQATCADGPHAGGDTAAPRSAALGDVVLDGPVRDARLFRDRLFPAASRRFLL
ncbi:hypothetical protein CGC20_25420 [Leishmania donovani]|uniref:Uncharacterized protein n=1 Tax=Leishmania donovani TaxID=5661 RepID=A0A504XPQ5_LEIDO|nr:hypothetical protein CGC20_25420 [Leishmania donovani]